MNIALIFIFCIAVLGILFAVFNFFKVKRMDEGTPLMAEIAAAIRVGSNTFLFKENMALLKVVAVIAIIIGGFIEPSAAFSFLIGFVMSDFSGLFAMKSSTYSNVRVTNKARTTKNIGQTLKVALRGGSVNGLLVGSLPLIGLVIVILLFRGQLTHIGTIANWCNISFEPFSMTVSSYALGLSMVAIFNRVGGGIYTKAADMGADLVGKTEENIPEDDPRNPATIADAVGDNVNDTAGLGSDLAESYMGAIASAIILTILQFVRYQTKGLEFSEELFGKLFMYPILFVALGLLSCMVGLLYAFYKKDGTDPHRELNEATWISAGLTAFSNMIMTLIMFRHTSLGDLPFRFGEMSPFVAAISGIASGVAIGAIAEYYTSYDYSPTKKISESSKEGPALTITQGLAVGMKSTLASVVILGIATMFSYFVAGRFGIAMAAVGMLSFVGITVSVDTFGPISDNAGGIAEMSGLESDVREITDKLDSVGNTTAAIGKGFAIGSAAFAAVSLMNSFLYAFSPIDSEVSLDLMNSHVLAGAFIGAAITYYFSGLLIEAVANSAAKMVDEVRRQFREIVGLREGKVKPDYKQCVGIATEGALSEMKIPALISIVVPVASGFIFGPEFVGGFLIGATLSAIMLAIFCGNSGGAWDNSKKLIEALGLKGTPQHIASVVGDTVGDPLKDTVGPSLDILIKIMSTISLIIVPIYSSFNLVTMIETWLA